MHACTPSSDSASSPSEANAAYASFKAVQNKLELLVLRCQEASSNYDERLRSLEDGLEVKKDHFLRELTEVESWLGSAYLLLCLEPEREEGLFDGDEEEEVADLSQEIEEEGGGGDAVLASRDGVAMSDSGEEFASDLSLGSGDFTGESPPHFGLGPDTSVDLRLSEDDFSNAVIDRVISPGGEEEEEEEEVVRYQNGAETAGAVDLGQCRLEPPDVTDLESVSSDSTLRGVPSSDGASPVRAGDEQAVSGRGGVERGVSSPGTEGEGVYMFHAILAFTQS